MGRRARNAAGPARAVEPLEVRPATAGDAEIVRQLNRHVQQLHADALPHLFKPPGDGIGAGIFEEMITRPETRVFIGYAAGEPVGYVAAQILSRPEQPLWYGMDVLVVDQIAVAPEHRGKGYGAQLLREAVTLAEARGIRQVELNVWTFNENARRFFAGQGFSIFNERMALDIDRGQLRSA